MARWFRRNKTINEASDYLRATDEVSRPLAVLLTVLTIVILASLLFTVFWGVKWTYDRIRNNDETTVTVVTPPAETDGGKFGTQNGNSGIAQGGSDQILLPGFVTPEQTQAGGSNQAGQSSGGSVRPSQGSSSQGSNSNTNSSSTSQSNSSSSNAIPNTGPVTNIAILVAIAVLGTISRNVFLISRARPRSTK